MKTSPLQLNWVSYPKISYEAIPKESQDGQPLPVSLVCLVEYNIDGMHMATVNLTSTEDADSTYVFSLAAVASFSFDFNLAEETYKTSRSLLPGTIAANICRIIFAGSREMMALITARAPYGAVMLASVLIEPSDVKIRSDVSENEAMNVIFHLNENEELLTNSEIVDKKVKVRRKKITTMPT